MKKFIVALALVLVLAGCSTAANKTPEKLADTNPPSATPTAESPSINAHGYLTKQIGELAGHSLTQTDQTPVSSFSVTQIELDPVCSSQYAQSPKNGHFVAVHMNIETTADLARATVPVVSFNQFGWEAYDPEGKRLNDPVGNGFSCMDSADLLPSEIGPGQSVSGLIILDVASPIGSLAYNLGGASGWEWNYPG